MRRVLAWLKKNKLRFAFLAALLLFVVNVHANRFLAPTIRHQPPSLITAPKQTDQQLRDSDKAALALKQRMGSRIIPSGGGGGGSTITQADLTWLGDLLLPNTDSPSTGADSQPIAFKTVSGVVHLMMVQRYEHGNFTAGTAGAGAIYEYTDPGGYTTSTPVHGTFVKNWGLDGSGNQYDMWHGKIGTTTCLSSTTWSNPGGFAPPCTLGATNIQIGDGGLGSNYVIIDAFWHDDGTGHCCVYTTFGQGYGNYDEDSNIAVADLISAGNTVAHRYRSCVGTYGVGGTGGQNCGGLRGLDMFEVPDGSWGIGGNSAPWQQSTANKGPSFAWGQTWISSSAYPAEGYGADRGTSRYRTTDLVWPTTALQLYSLDSNINCDGTIASGPNITFRRPTSGTYGNYTYENAGLCASEEPDPLLYGGVGGFTSVDHSNGQVWVNTTPKSGIFVGMTLSFGHTWYRTNAGQTYQERGTGPVLIFQRNVDESAARTNTGDIDADVDFQVKPAFYTNVVANAAGVKFLNPGTPSAGFSVTVSGNIVTVHLATNGSSVVTTTANDVVTGITGNTSANAIFAVSVPGTGLHTVDTIAGSTIPGTTDSGGSISGGVLTPCHGPQWCPLHNVDSHVVNTGPVSSHWEPAMAIYSTTDMANLPTSGLPEYSLDPTSIIYFKDIDPSIQWGTIPNPATNAVGSLYFDYGSSKLYVEAPWADTTTWGVFLLSPIVHVFSVNTSVPVPLEIAGSLGVMYLLFLVIDGKRRLRG